MKRLWQKIKEIADLAFLILIILPIIWLWIKVSHSDEGFWWEDED
jgi:hypothetical protein